MPDPIVMGRRRSFRGAPPEVARVLARAAENGTRLAIEYGATEGNRTGYEGEDATPIGTAWGGPMPSGRIGFSCGRVSVPLTIHNVRSLGGASILLGSIVRIRHANKKNGGDLYRHPQYRPAS